MKKQRWLRMEKIHTDCKRRTLQALGQTFKIRKPRSSCFIWYFFQKQTTRAPTAGLELSSAWFTASPRPYDRHSICQEHCAVLFIILSCFHSERELVMDLERLKLAKSVKPKKSRDKVYRGFTFYLKQKASFWLQGLPRKSLEATSAHASFFRTLMRRKLICNEH